MSWKKKKQAMSKNRSSDFSFSLIELLLLIALVSVLAGAAVPNFISHRQEAYDASARSAGRNAKLAEEVWYSDRWGMDPSYTDQLSDLLTVDRNLTDDNDVTFEFGVCNTSGFTLWTVHALGTLTYTYHD